VEDCGSFEWQWGYHFLSSFSGGGLRFLHSFHEFKYDILVRGGVSDSGPFIFFRFLKNNIKAFLYL
jgi:hypothetical protein